MTSAFLTLTICQGHTIRSKVTDVEVSAFSECFLFFSKFLSLSFFRSLCACMCVYVMVCLYGRQTWRCLRSLIASCLSLTFSHSFFLSVCARVCVCDGLPVQSSDYNNFRTNRIFNLDLSSFTNDLSCQWSHWFNKMIYLSFKAFTFRIAVLQQESKAKG